MDGIIIIDKPQGMTSHDVVNRLRRILKTKKIGHAGTLDPMATGVLVIGVGRATKLLRFLTADHKTYRATLTLGKATDTYDLEGNILCTESYRHDLDEQKIKKVFASFLGSSMQLPPLYSAIKVNGRKLYEYARNNQDVEVEPREIYIERLALLKHENEHITFETCCSKGTYIRSLCVDLAEKLGYPGVMSSLRRLSSGRFTIEDACTLEQVESGIFPMIPFDSALNHFPALTIEDPLPVYQGKKLAFSIDHEVAVYDACGHLLAVYEPDQAGGLRCVRGLWS